MIRRVLFDLGNVLVRYEPMLFWEVLGETDASLQTEMKPRMHALGRLYESGAIATEEFRIRFRSLFGDRYSQDVLFRAFLSVLPGPTDRTDELVRKVSRRYDLALVSNTNPLHFDLCLRTIPVLRQFQRFYLSYELRAMKPDDAFYRGVEAGEETAPADMVFIDDLEENIEAASRSGFRGIRFTDAPSLEKDLARLGVL